MTVPRVLLLPVLLAAILGTGCGGSSATPTARPALTGVALKVEPQDARLLVGVNRIGIALFQGPKDTPVSHAVASLDITPKGGGATQSRPLEYIGPKYGDIPVYVGTAKFTTSGDYSYTVHARLPDGTVLSGSAPVSVTTQSPELPVGFAVPTDVTQQVLADVHGDVSVIDSGVPPDTFHDHTVSEGLRTHHPMMVFFGQPGHCASETCGPTIGVIKDFATTYGSRVWIEHIEVHIPADSETLNPFYVRFGLTSEPWIYFINAQGIVSDRFGGPVTADELATAADGTLAGRVPAVVVTAS